jgi:hypothetical protein
LAVLRNQRPPGRQQSMPMPWTMPPLQTMQLLSMMCPSSNKPFASPRTCCVA